MAKKRIYTYNTWQMETDEELEENLDAILREMDSRGILGVRFVGQDAGIVQNVVIEHAQAIIEAATGRCAPDDGDPCCGAKDSDDLWQDMTPEMVECAVAEPITVSVAGYEITIKVTR